MTEYNTDNVLRQPVGVTSIPEGINDYLYAGVTLGAGTSLNLVITIYASNKQLSLWNLFFSVYIDNSLNNDYLFPNGQLLSSGQKNATMSNFFDWAESSDLTNTRVYKIRLSNNDSSSHNYYFFVKGYTFSTIGGST